MFFNIYLIIVILIYSPRSTGTEECISNKPESSELKLKYHLLCEYKSEIRPVFDQTTSVDVLIRLLLLELNYYQDKGLLQLSTWTYLSWKDQFLTWKPNEFGGLEEIKMKSEDLWTPDLSVLNSDNYQSGISNAQCTVTEHGEVVCLASKTYNSHCNADFSKWPYDSHQCTITLSSVDYFGEHVDFNFWDKKINMEMYKETRNWHLNAHELRKSTIGQGVSTTIPVLSITVDIQRHSALCQEIYIILAIALMVLTLTTLWLDHDSIERITLLSISFISHIICMYNLQSILPPHGHNVPKILLFYRNSLLLIVFSMIVTGLVRKFSTMTTHPPVWIESLNTFLSGNFIGKILFPNIISNSTNTAIDNTQIDLEPENAPQQSISSMDKINKWKNFGVIIDCAMFYSASVFYMIIVLIRLPWP